MGRVPGAVHGQVFFGYCSPREGSGVPRAEAGDDDCDGLCDYVATDMAKVRRFENGLKLSIRGRIVGLRLQDMDSMVGTTLTIEREIEDTRSTRDAGVSSKRKESQSSSSSGKKQRASSSRGFQGRSHPGQGHIRVVGQVGQIVCYHCQQLGHMRRDCP